MIIEAQSKTLHLNGNDFETMSQKDEPKEQWHIVKVCCSAQ